MSEKIYVLTSKNLPLYGHSVAMCEGLQRHGYDTELAQRGTNPKDAGSFVVTWGWRDGKRLRDLGYNVLVMECGYIGDRINQWVSLGWNGLNGRAAWNAPADDGERFEENFGRYLKPWKQDRAGYAIIMGQVRGDAAISEIVIDRWYPEVARDLERLGYEVKFRPHPVAVQRKIDGIALRGQRIEGTLEEALSGASVCVTWNSNSGVDAALAGVPVIACDEGSMALDVASHAVSDPLVTPDREDWCNRLAWRQWSPEEMRSGYAWDHVGKVLPLILNPVPDLGARGRTALIIAGGSRVKEDINTALTMFTPDIVIAVNDIGAEYHGPVDHWVTNHPEKMVNWQAKRAENGFAPAGRIWTVTHKAEKYPYQHVVNPGGGSSATAVAVAREMGAERIVLAGVPLTSTPHFFDNVPWDHKEVAHYQRHWMRQKMTMIHCVRSVSGGFTEKHLGRPTREWIEGICHEDAA